jgi:S-DNA-T family DNA segregation ATPase FtsK/SpoIIIE
MVTACLFLALATDGLRGATSGRPVEAAGEIDNALGPPGAYLAGFLILLVGHGAHFLYCVLAVWGAMLIRHMALDRLPTRILGMILLTTAMAGILHIDGYREGGAVYPGGILGAFLGEIIVPLFGAIGSHVVLATVAVIGILLSTEFLFVRFFTMLRRLSIFLLEAVREFTAMAQAQARARAAQKEAANGPAKPEKKPKAKTARKSLPLPAAEEEMADPIDIRIHKDGQLLDKDGNSPFDAIPATGEVSKTDAKPEPTPAVVELAPVAEAPVNSDIDEDVEEATQLELDAEPMKLEPPAEKPKRDRPMPRRKNQDRQALPADFEYPKAYKKPSIDIFESAPPVPKINIRKELEHTSSFLEETLLTFGVEAKVTDVTRGPAITRFELEPAPGVKVSRFMALADDLALALKAHRVRIEAPIPGKGRVGIEVPNKEREPVVIRELLESPIFRKNTNTLNLCLGKDIAGEVSVADLARMPHLLVAGATGAGKTVCIKTMLASLLYAKTPDEMQLILIDPKMVELSIFDDIPHLITPVVTDPKKASLSLSWLITEMEERYRLFAHLRVRNIEVYNESVDNGEIEMPADEGEEQESVEVIRKLPYIVCVIDELADLMMLARAEVEDAIARIAQLARAVGIHMIIATQRPSVDVLTGVIKANFPSRISFQVSSRVDSRCILDEIGAERLIGQGDMLHLPAGQAKPMRTQGAFVSDEEMDNLINYLKTQAPPQYRDEIENFGKDSDGVDDFGDFDDELLDDAVRVVVDTGQASISMVQRRLRVGYTRAARLIDMMEQKGVVGPHVGSKAREILVSTPPKDEVA